MFVINIDEEGKWSETNHTAGSWEQGPKFAFTDEKLLLKKYAQERTWIQFLKFSPGWTTKGNQFIVEWSDLGWTTIEFKTTFIKELLFINMNNILKA